MTEAVSIANFPNGRLWCCFNCQKTFNRKKEAEMCCNYALKRIYKLRVSWMSRQIETFKKDYTLIISEDLNMEIKLTEKEQKELMADEKFNKMQELNDELKAEEWGEQDY